MAKRPLAAATMRHRGAVASFFFGVVQGQFDAMDCARSAAYPLFGWPLWESRSLPPASLQPATPPYWLYTALTDEAHDFQLMTIAAIRSIHCFGGPAMGGATHCHIAIISRVVNLLATCADVFGF